MLSIEPHPDGQDEPDTLQRTELSGCPLLDTDARNDWAPPKEMLTLPGINDTEMSLVMLMLTVANVEESALLVAITWTVPPWGRSSGAVYTPSTEIHPT